jgi:flavin-dependent dehydrogenase
MNTIKPIAIIGGGLAGLSLGIALRKAGVPTRLYEAGDYPRHRVCGEFITGLDDVTIARLEIGAAFTGAGRHRSVTWFWREQAVGRNALVSPARALSRYYLDTRLAELFVAAGGELLTNTRYNPPTLEPGMVQANGRKRIGASPWMGLKLHARNLPPADDLELHLGDGAYVGLSAVEDGWINVCGLFRRRPGLRFDHDDALPAYLRASGLHALAERLKTAIIRPGSRCGVAGFMFDRRIGRGGGLRLGDACAVVPPFTGNGMAMAFASAAIAVEPLVAWARGERLWEDVTRDIDTAIRAEFRLRLASAALLHPFLLNRGGQRCLAGALRSGLLPITTLYRLLH